MDLGRGLNPDETGATDVAGATSSPGRLSPINDKDGKPRSRSVTIGSQHSDGIASEVKGPPKGKNKARARSPAPSPKSERAGSHVSDEADSDASDPTEGETDRAAGSNAEGPEAPDSDAESSASADSPRPSAPPSPTLFTRSTRGKTTVQVDTTTVRGNSQG